MYLRGEGVTQSDALAREWFRRLRHRGNRGADQAGILYASGRAGQRDAEKGVCLDFGGEMVEIEGEEYLAPLEKELTAEQFGRAKEKARELLSSQEQAKTKLAFLR